MVAFAGLPEGFPVGGIAVEREGGRYVVKRLISGTMTYGRNQWLVIGKRDTRDEADRLALEVL